MASDNSNDKRPDDSRIDGDLSKRLDTLKTRLKTEEERHVQPMSKGDKAGVGMAMRLSSEFIAGVVVGGAIGYGCDYFLGTSPWGLIFFLLLGFVAAVINVMRSAGMVAESGMRLHNARELAEKSASSQNKDADE